MRFLIVLVFAAAVRLWMLPLEHSPDESVYIQHAWNLAHGQLSFDNLSQYVHRFPVYVPTALAYWLGGIGPWTTAAWPILASLAQIFLAMALARRIAGNFAATVAGLALALLPLDIVYSAHLLADVPMGAMTSAAVVAWWFAHEAGVSTRRQSLLSATAGALLALAAIVRTYAAIVALLFVFDLLLRRSSFRTLGFAVLGAIATSLPVLLLYRTIVGDFFFPFRVVRHVYSEGRFTDPTGLLYYPAELLAPTGYFALFGPALVASLIWSLAAPDSARLRLLIWMAWIGAFLQFGSMSLEAYVPILKAPRFLTPITLPASVLIGSAAAGALGLSGERRRWVLPPAAFGRLRGPSLVVILIAWGFVSGSIVWELRGAQRSRYRAVEQVATLLAQHPDLPVLFDHWRTAIALAPHVRFGEGFGFYHGREDALRMVHSLPVDDRYGYLVWYSQAQTVPAALVVVDRRATHYRVRDGGAGRGPSLPAYLWDLPSEWKLLFTAEELALYETPARVD
jgi:4-amino-4-deoxy-L-arabinose transferase-like glycosyltransferase